MRKVPFDNYKKIESILLYLVYRGSRYLTQTRLQKLFYLAEVKSIEKSGKRLTEAEFLNWDYGPWSPEVSMVLDGLRDRGVRLDDTVVRGHKARIARPSKSKVKVDLSSDEMNLLQELLDEWKYKKTDFIVRNIKGSEPFVWSKLGQKIDFDAYSDCCRKLYRDGKTKETVLKNRKEKGRFFSSVDELEEALASE